MGRTVLAALASAVMMAGCANPLIVDPAPYAADPDCARVMLSIPPVVGGLDQRAASSQATTAWGTDSPIVARCGVEPSGPTTDQCVAIETGDITVYWLIVDDGDNWRATVFGRSPALEMLVPKVRADQALGDVLGEVSVAAARARENGLECR